MAMNPTGVNGAGTATLTTAPSPSPQPHEDQQDQHQHQYGKRLRQFLRPDGRKIHIAATPEEYDQLKRQLSETEADSDFDVFIHGSLEHVPIPPQK
jgi:hypothetical protein